MHEQYWPAISQLIAKTTEQLTAALYLTNCQASEVPCKIGLHAGSIMLVANAYLIKIGKPLRGVLIDDFSTIRSAANDMINMLIVEHSFYT